VSEDRIARVATRLLLAGPNAVEETAATLRGGGLAVFPTETVYGLATLASCGAAVRRIYAAKGRAYDKPLQLLVASLEAIDSVAELTPQVCAAAARFLPGGLTLVLRARPGCPLSVRAGGATVGVRVPDHPFALEVLRHVAEPVAATSANRSSEPSPTSAAAARVSMEGLVDVLVDGGVCAVARDSSVLDLSGPAPRLLRAGAIAREDLEAAFGPVAV